MSQSIFRRIWLPGFLLQSVIIGGGIDLIAGGYGTLTWVMMAIFILPLCTIGTWKIVTYMAR